MLMKEPEGQWLPDDTLEDDDLRPSGEGPAGAHARAPVHAHLLSLDIAADAFDDETLVYTPRERCEPVPSTPKPASASPAALESGDAAGPPADFLDETEPSVPRLGSDADFVEETKVTFDTDFLDETKVIPSSLLQATEIVEETKPNAVPRPLQAEFLDQTSPSLTVAGSAVPSGTREAEPSVLHRINSALGLLAIALGSAAVTYHWLPLPSLGQSRTARADGQPATSSSSNVRSASAPKSSRKLPTVNVAAAKNPTEQAAAMAFARGDFTEALAHYRGLSAGRPQPAYEIMVRVLERRLSSKRQ